MRDPESHRAWLGGDGTLAIHDLENSRNPKESRRLWVEQCLELACHSETLSPALKARAQELEAIGIKPFDALHAAAAETSQCSHLLTCDDRFLKRYTGPLTALNPADFVVQYFHQGP